ncbi:MAG: hypothetical protein Q8Q09_22400 [Deltaproteobacteria bacterium]|nr:hypothetical protein [Deltaproteobacteria bacterium]
MAAAASVLSLGVSVVGFAVVTHKLNKIQKSVSQLTQLVALHHQQNNAHFAEVKQQLVELQVLACESRDLQVQCLTSMEQFRAEFLDQYTARVLTHVEILSQASTPREQQLDTARLAFVEARRWAGLRMQQTRIEDSVDRFHGLLLYRLWCLAAIAELHLLRRVGELQAAATLSLGIAQHAREWAKRWREALMPTHELGGAFRFAHSAFADLHDETFARLVRMQDGTELRGSDPRELPARLETTKVIAQYGPAWVDRERGQARVLDFLEESTSRLESLADEYSFCAENLLAFDDWEGIKSTGNVNGIAVIERDQVR